jgi:predicted RNase H-like HicB family nuclease
MILVIRAYISVDNRRISFELTCEDTFSLKGCDYFLARPGNRAMTSEDMREAEVGALRILFWDRGISDIESYAFTWSEGSHKPSPEQIRQARARQEEISLEFHNDKWETAYISYTAIYEEAEEGGYIGYVEGLPGANTQGETLEEVRENLIEAARLILEANREAEE